jgi:hypothetical protein
VRRCQEGQPASRATLLARTPHTVSGDPRLRLGARSTGVPHVDYNAVAVPAGADEPGPAGRGLLPSRYSGHTQTLYAYQLRRWFGWCETNGLDPLRGIQRAHVELYIRHLGESGLMVSSVNTSMHAVRGFFWFAHIDGLIPATRPCTPGSPRSTRMRHAPKGYTGSSSSDTSKSPRP